MSAATRASVVIPVWNGEAFLPGCLESLAAQTGVVFEVIAVDNGSTDGSAAVVARYPQVRLLRLPRNRGFAAACNAGAAAATGQVVVFLNQDTRVEPGWLVSLLAPLAEPGVGAVGCKLLYGDGQRIQHAGGYVERPNWYGRHYGCGEIDHGQWDEPRQVEFVTGAALAVPRQAFAEHGGFDEGFYPAYFEDVDLCLRFRRAGLSVLYQPSARAVHFESASRDGIDLSLAYNASRLRLVLKHCELGDDLAAFLAAEREQPYLSAMAGGCQAMAQAYVSAMISAPPVLAARGATPETAQDVVDAFRRMYLDAVAYDYVLMLRGGIDAGAPAPDLRDLKLGEEQLLGPLEEYQFRSPLPLIGRLREACFSIAARWALRHLVAQQNVRNRRYDEALVRLADLRQTDALLADRLAALEARFSDHMGGGGGRER